MDLDPAAIERLTRLGGGSFLVKMIDLFLGYGAEKLAEARQASDAGDLAAVEKAVHPLKSSVGNLGAARLQQLALDAEQRAREGDAAAVSTLLDQLEAAFQSLRPLLDAERAKATSGRGTP